MSTGESQGAPPSPATGGSVLLSRDKDWGKGPSDGRVSLPQGPSPTQLWCSGLQSTQPRSGSAPVIGPWALPLAAPFGFPPPLSLNISPAQNKLHFPHASLTCPSPHPLNLSSLPPSSNHPACASLSLYCTLASFILSHASVYSRPSVYWTERFLEDTTLTITVPGRLSPTTTSTFPSGVT